ncbi:xenoxin-2-like [Trichomycterus rosablanca]|uniref:xenoxin-2-like n=1 Tax=Trichomycterus rosablanca TaxID=2290929 RepID=UPI002F35337C
MRSQVVLLLFCMFFIAAHIQSASGLKCYSCEGSDCSKTKECGTLENRCYSATAKVDSKTVSMKACVNEAFCDVAKLPTTPGVSVESVKCCDGNLCNGAETFTLSFLILLVPLLSSILLH